MNTEVALEHTSYVFVFILFHLGLFGLLYFAKNLSWAGAILAFIDRKASMLVNLKGHWILSFLFLTLMRDFLENLIERPEFTITFYKHLDYTICWIAMFLSIWPFIKWVAKISYEDSFKLTVIGWLVIFLAPPLNQIFYQSEAFSLGYVGSHFFENYFSFYQYQPVGYGANFGVKVEIIVASLTTLLFAWSKTRSIWRAFAGFFGMHSIIFVYMTLPALYLEVTKWFGAERVLEYPLDYVVVEVIIVLFMLVYLTLQGAFSNPTIKQDLSFDVTLPKRTEWFWYLRNLRPERLLFYVAITLSGGLVLPRLAGYSIILEPMQAVWVCLSIVFIWAAVVNLNDIFDLDIDRISNVNRPLVTGSVRISTMWFFVFVSLVLALGCSSFINSACRDFVLYYFSFVFLYSAPPFRLRRFFPLANVTVGFCVLLATLIGYSAVAQEAALRPKFYLLSILIGFSLISTLKDLKDTEGDRASGVTTISTLFGDRTARICVAVILMILVLYCNNQMNLGLRATVFSLILSFVWILAILYRYEAVVILSSPLYFLGLLYVQS